jgi:hypothetical protein
MVLLFFGQHQTYIVVNADWLQSASYPERSERQKIRGALAVSNQIAVGLSAKWPDVS